MFYFFLFLKKFSPLRNKKTEKRIIIRGDHLRLSRQLHKLSFVNLKQFLYLHKLKGRKLDCLFQVLSCYRSRKSCDHLTATNSQVYWISLYHFVPIPGGEKTEISMGNKYMLHRMNNGAHRALSKGWTIKAQLPVANKNSPWTLYSWILLIFLLLKHLVLKAMNNTLNLHIGTPIEKTLLCHGSWRRS